LEGHRILVDAGALLGSEFGDVIRRDWRCEVVFVCGGYSGLPCTDEEEAILNVVAAGRFKYRYFPADVSSGTEASL
jgi:hypothetical protein